MRNLYNRLQWKLFPNQSLLQLLNLPLPPRSLPPKHRNQPNKLKLPRPLNLPRSTVTVTQQSLAQHPNPVSSDSNTNKTVSTPTLELNPPLSTQMAMPTGMVMGTHDEQVDLSRLLNRARVRE